MVLSLLVIRRMMEIEDHRVAVVLGNLHLEKMPHRGLLKEGCRLKGRAPLRDSQVILTRNRVMPIRNLVTSRRSS